VVLFAVVAVLRNWVDLPVCHLDREKINIYPRHVGLSRNATDLAIVFVALISLSQSAD
jgi:hypothetical protein